MNNILSQVLETIPSESVFDTMTETYAKDILFLYGAALVENKIPFALYFIDFDNFKKVNDGVGHVKGDEALHDCAKVLKDSIGESGYIFRYGGDEFAIICENVKTRDEEWAIPRAFSQAIRKNTFDYLQEVFPEGRITVTTGACRYPFDAKNFDELVTLADKALYRGKNKGKNCFIIYDKVLHKDIDVFSKSTKLTTRGLLSFVFERFKQYDMNNPYLYLKYIFNMVAKYYGETFVSFHSEKEHVLLYSDSDNKESEYYPFTLDMLNLQPNEESSVIYYPDLLQDEKRSELRQILSSSHIRSLLVYKVLGINKENAVIAIHARRDKIWSDDQLYVYQTIAQLFTLLNIKIDFKKPSEIIKK